MRKSLADRIASNPQKYANMIWALVVAALLLCVVLVTVWIAREFIEPPLPSEDTPLSLVETDSIAWIKTPDSPLAGEPMDHGVNYSSIAFIWQFVSGSSTLYCMDFLANESQQEALSSGSPVTTVPWRSTHSYLEVVELAGDGYFGPGDSLVLHNISAWMDYAAHEENDVIGVVGLMMWAGVSGPIGEYSFAIEDGELRAWSTRVLDWTPTWYDRLLD
jgi:hypothetical protein